MAARKSRSDKVIEPKRCITPNCLNNARRDRKRCTKCESRLYRKCNPIRATYHIIKGNAKRRGVFFDLTYEQFKQFCDETGYLKYKGTHSWSMSIDRKVNSMGYTSGNIQMITLAENTKKRNQSKQWSTRVPRQADDPF
jgi:hypothetical protein